MTNVVSDKYIIVDYKARDNIVPFIYDTGGDGDPDENKFDGS